MKRGTLIVSVAVAAILVAALTSGAFGQAVAFSSSNYYIFALQGTAADLDALSLAVQSDGFSVVRYEDNSAIAYQGGQLSALPVVEVLSGSHVLIADGSRFLLRVAEENYTYTLRPSAAGLELVFSPNTDQSIDALVDVLFELQALGVIGSEVDFGYEAYAKNALKGPAPPAGLRIDSDLYGLTVAEDWHAFAATKGISLIGLHVEVIAEILPDTLIPAEFFGYVVSESESLVELLLPIDQLLALAGASNVGLVRQAYQPVAP